VKTVTCNECRGTGVYFENMPCVRCSGRGVLDEQRILHLRNMYYPNRLRKNAIAQSVFEKKIQELDLMLNDLESNHEHVQPGTEPVLLSIDLCMKYDVTYSTTFRELQKHFPLIYVKEF